MEDGSCIEKSSIPVLTKNFIPIVLVIWILGAQIARLSLMGHPTI